MFHFAFFCLVFQATSWLATFRDVVYRIYVEAELAIPFVPEWIWAYGSMFVVVLIAPIFLGPRSLLRLGIQCNGALLISCAVFLAFPGHLGFVREVPDAEPYRQLFEWLFATDRANNLFPSLHVSVSAICLAAYAWSVSSSILRAFLFAWLAAIMASTVLVHQHHLADVAGGVAVAWAVRRFLPMPARARAGLVASTPIAIDPLGPRSIGTSPQALP